MMGEKTNTLFSPFVAEILSGGCKGIDAPVEWFSCAILSVSATDEQHSSQVLESTNQTDGIAE